MVEHDVEHDFEAGFVQRAHHRLELGDGVLDRIAGLGREPGQRVVTPVIRQPAVDEELLADRGLHRHQLDRRDTELLQVRDHGRVRETEVLAAQVFRHFGMALRKALDVRLVNDRVAPGHARRAILAPVERAIDDAALGHTGSAVGVRRAIVVARLGAEKRVVPYERALQCQRARIDEQLVRIEAMPVLRVVGPMHAVAVEHSRSAEAGGQETVPDIPGTRWQLETRDLRAALGIEQAQFDAFGVRREHRKIGAATGPVRAQ